MVNEQWNSNKNEIFRRMWPYAASSALEQSRTLTLTCNKQFRFRLGIFYNPSQSEKLLWYSSSIFTEDENWY